MLGPEMSEVFWAIEKKNTKLKSPPAVNSTLYEGKYWCCWSGAEPKEMAVFANCD